MIPWPKPTSSSGIFAAWLNRLLGKCQSEQLLESRLFGKQYTAHGFFLYPKFQITSAPGQIGGGTISLFLVNATGNGADYLSGQQIVGSQLSGGTPVFQQSGQTVQIAKWFQHRPSNYLTIPEIFDGVTVTYQAPPAIAGADPAYNDNNRVATINSNGQNQIENQVLFPRYTTVGMTGAAPVATGGGVNFYAVNSIHQALIAAVKVGPTNLNGVFVNGAEVSWLEIPQRVWAKRYNQ